MDPQVEAKTVNVGVMQASVGVALNTGIGNRAVCQTAANTAAKTVTISNKFFDLVDEPTILVVFNNAITVANATLNVTYTDATNQEVSTGAKPIFYRGAALAANLVKAGSAVTMTYDGTKWDIVGDLTPSGFKFEYDASDKSLNIIPIGSAEASYDSSDKSLNLNF